MTHSDMVRWEPFLRNAIAGRFNQLFDSATQNRGSLDISAWSPPVDIYDNGTALVLEAELPGFSKNDFDIRVENNVLMLSGERRRESGDVQTDAYVRRERATGPFGRTFALPMSVDHARIDAAYQDGILRITLPKSEAAMPKRIDVKFH